MIQARKKLIGGFILLLLLSAAFCCLLAFANFTVYLSHSFDIRTAQINAIQETLKNVNQEGNAAVEDVLTRHSRRIALYVAFSGDEIIKESGGKPCCLQKGAVIRVSDGQIELPEGFPEDIIFDADAIIGDIGVAYSHPVGEKDGDVTAESTFYVINYNRLDGSLFYIEWFSESETSEELNKYYASDDNLSGIENAFDVRILMLSPDPDSDGNHVIYYRSDDLPAYRTAEEYGITEEMISHRIKESAETDFSNYLEELGLLDIDGTHYELILQEWTVASTGETYVNAYLISMEKARILMREQIILVLAVFFMIGVFLIVWFYATMILVKKHVLNDNQKKELEMKTIRRRAVSITGIGALSVFLVAIMLMLLFRLFSTCRQVETAFASLRKGIEENKKLVSTAMESQMGMYKQYASDIAEALTERPELMNREDLDVICSIIDADSIMLFDSSGNETLSNSRYVGLSISRDSSLSDFRRLLNGTALIAKEAEFDEVAGEENVKIGASFGIHGDGENYEALILTVPKEKIYDSTIGSISNIMSSRISEGLVAFSVDPETGTVINSTDSSLIGGNVQAMGLPENALISGYRDFFTLNGRPYYGESVDIDGTLYYYAALKFRIYRHVPEYAASVAAGAFVLLILLAIYILHGYKKYFEEWSEIGTVLNDNGSVVRMSGGQRKYSVDPSKRWKENMEEFGIYAPFHTAFGVLENLLAVCIVIAGITVVTSGTEDNSLITFIVSGQWTKGRNLFAFTSIMMLAAEVILSVKIVKMLLHLISQALGTKGETVCRLLINLTGYVGAIAFVYFSLYNLGFRPDTLLASLGLLSFAVSLGAKDMITDVIAGLSIVFEGVYQVGDIIDVGGYRGEVLEIGVRSTKIEGRGGNIKIMNNRDVKNVVNMTRLNSWYPLDVSISGDQPLGEVERLLGEQLPLIGGRIPEIVSGPYYKGVIAIGKGVVTISIITECSESNYHIVQREVNRAVHDLFEENGIKIL